MRRLLAPLTILLALALAQPAGASRTQSLTFEAPRDLMSPASRADALTEINSFGVRSLRVILTWQSVAPAADKAQRPDFEPTDPASYDWGEYEPLIAAIKERGWSVLMTISGPVPKWATQSKLDNLTRPSPAAFAAFATAVGVVMYAHRNQAGELPRPVGAGAFGRVAGRLRGLFKEFL